MKISIITVCFNSARTIGDTLKSVASQSYQDIEHIVIDGASNDQTLEIVKRDGAHVVKVVSEPDLGIYDAMNKGLALATGEAVGFLNSDDIFATVDSVAAIAGGLADDTVDAVYGDLVFVDPVNPERVRRIWRPGPHFPGACARGWMAPHPTFYIRRKILQNVGGFDLAFKLQSDFDLMLRVFESERIKTRYLPVVLIRMRMGGATTGTISNIIRGNLEAERACRRAGFSGGLQFIVRKLASRVPQFLHRLKFPNQLGKND